jgi:hypothetical protein
MSGSEWSKYLNGGTSQYNFSYKSNTPSAPVPNSTPAPIPISTPVPISNITNKKNNNIKMNNMKTNNIKINNKNKTISGGKRKSRRHMSKRK